MKQIILFSALIFSFSIQAQHGSVSALDFNGSTDYVEIPNNASLNPGANFTIEAWIKADAWATSSWQNTIVSKDQWTANSEGWVLRCGSNGVVSFNLALNNNSSWYEVTSPPLLSINKWYHVAGTYDGSVIRLFVNGKEVGSSNQTGSITASSAPVKIGNIAMAGQSRFFNGEIDEVRIWNETLSPATLRQYMCHKIDGNHPDLPDLLAHYTLNAGTGNTIFDMSGNALNGTKFGTTWIVSGAPLGDGSDYVYNNSWSGKSFKYGHINGDSILVSNVSGNPNGAHIYFIDAPANYSIPPIGVASLSPDRYYGVFFTEGTNPTYKLTFEYNGFPGVSTNSILNYNNRTDHSDSTWQTVNVTLDSIQKTMIKTNSSAGEFILGFNDNLTSFDLNAPPNASSFTIQGGSSQVVHFNWRMSVMLFRGGSADYEWYLDYDTANFQSPIVQRNSASGGSDTLLNVSYGNIGNYMTSAGVYYGETLKAQWTVKAIAGPLEKFANQSHTIDFVRGILSTDVIFNFLLFSPDNDTISVFNAGNAVSPFTWNPSNSTAGPNLTYEVQIAGENGSFNAPLGTFPSDNGGLDTVANISDADLATMLQNASIPNDVLVKFKWRVVASIGTLSKTSLDSNFVFIERTGDPTIGIEENVNEDYISIYPNPVTNKLTLRINSNELKGSVAVLFNTEGKEMLSQMLENEINTIEMPRNLHNGLYYLSVQTEEGRIVRKIQISR